MDNTILVYRRPILRALTCIKEMKWGPVVGAYMAVPHCCAEDCREPPGVASPRPSVHRANFLNLTAPMIHAFRSVVPNIVDERADRVDTQQCGGIAGAEG